MQDGVCLRSGNVLRSPEVVECRSLGEIYE